MTTSFGTDSQCTVIIPCYNEEKGVGLVLDDLQVGLLKAEVIVGDNNSTDRTYKVCWERGADPVKVSRQGKGAVIRELIKRVETPYVVMIDGDHTYSAKHVWEAFWALANGADVVAGCRMNKQEGAMPAANLLGNIGLSLLASALYLRPIPDLCTGLWGFRSNLLREMAIDTDGFCLEAFLFTECVRKGYRIKYLPISYLRRPDGSKTKLKVSHGLEIGWYLIKRRIK